MNLKEVDNYIILNHIIKITVVGHLGTSDSNHRTFMQFYVVLLGDKNIMDRISFPD